MSHTVNIENPSTTHASSTVQSPMAKPRRRVRILSLTILLITLALMGAGVHAIFHAFKDSYVAPIILSPDSDIVIQQKLNLSRLMAERQALLSRIEENKTISEASGKAIDELKELQASSRHSLDWATNITERQKAHGSDELSALKRQERVIAEMIEHQESYLAEMAKNLQSGLVHKVDYERERASLSHLRVAALQNEREQRTAEMQLQMASQAKRALATSKAKAKITISTPEMQAQREQIVRVELELLKLESERRAKLAQQHVDEEALAKLDELLAQMKQRPIYRAIQSSQNVAFVPYTQIDGVRPSARVFKCSVWGVFSCNDVGSVAEVLPGEVVTQDPWGSTARGQYAILALSDLSAAQSKVLRVRKETSTSQPGQPVAALSH